jgi:hypothetical protein
MLGRLEVAFTSARDEEALDDLAQLRGLCERADAEAMLPLSEEDLDPRRPQRQIEFQRVVERTAGALVRSRGFSLKGRQTATGNGFGRSLVAPSGKVVYLWVSLPLWAWKWPTPWWLWLKDPEKHYAAWAEAIKADPGVRYAAWDGGENGHVDVGLDAPLGVEEERIADQLAETIDRICRMMPELPSGATPESLQDALPEEAEPGFDEPGPDAT